MFKVLKNGFAAIIAVLAITVTVAAQAGAFNETSLNAKAPIGCFSVVNLAPGAPALPSPCQTGYIACLNVTNPFDANSEVNPEDCVPPLDPICCFQVESVATTVCPSGFRVNGLVCGIEE